MTALSCYRTAPDVSRRDSSEGMATYRDNHGLETATINGNADEQYILCCSTPDVNLDYLREKMGQHIVKINDPQAFVRELETFLAKANVATLNGVHGRLVEYTKGETRPVALDAGENFDLSLHQKDRSFQPECVYRIFVILGRGETPIVRDSHLHVELGKPLDCAEILT